MYLYTRVHVYTEPTKYLCHSAIINVTHIVIVSLYSLCRLSILHTPTSSSSKSLKLSSLRSSNEEIHCSPPGRSNSFPAKFAIRFYPTFLQDLSEILWQHTSTISPALHRDFSTLLCILYICHDARTWIGTLLLQNFYIHLSKVLAKQVFKSAQVGFKSDLMFSG